MVRGPEQHRLVFQQHAGFAILQDALDDVIRLARFVPDVHQERAHASVTVAPEVFGVPSLSKADDVISGREDGPR
jgi:hypothetical protein